MPIKYLSKIKPEKLSEKTCILRTDFNVEPKYEHSSLRIDSTIPTIKFLLKNKARIILISHRGRPDKKGSNKNPKDFSLKPFINILKKRTDKDIHFISHCNIQELKDEGLYMDDNEIIPLEE